MSYWNNAGKYQALAELLDIRIPAAGSVPEPKKNRALERYRKAANVYYDTFNNGLINRQAQFYPIFKFRASDFKLVGRYREYNYKRLQPLMDEVMDEIIYTAAVEQGLVASP